MWNEWTIRNRRDLWIDADKEPRTEPEIKDSEWGDGQYYELEIPNGLGYVRTTERELFIEWLRVQADKLEALPELSAKTFLP